MTKHRRTSDAANHAGKAKGSDGKTQPTYNRWPLYTYPADSGPGQAHRHTFRGSWSASTDQARWRRQPPRAVEPAQLVGHHERGLRVLTAPPTARRAPHAPRRAARIGGAYWRTATDAPFDRVAGSGC